MLRKAVESVCFLEGRRITKKPHSQDSQSPNKNQNLGPPEHEGVGLPTLPQLSVNVTITGK
jgi:hypothetical protein